MTLPRERFAAITKTRTFLAALIDPKRTPNIPAPIRQEARACLKHYPTVLDMDEALHGLTLAARVWAAVEPLPKHRHRPPKSD